MEQKVFIEKLKAINDLINSAPIDNYEMILEIAAIIFKNYFEANSTVIFLCENKNSINSFTFASQSFSTEELTRIESFRPLAIFDEILKNEQIIIKNFDKNDKEERYLGKTTLFAPLIANGKPFGVVLVNNPDVKVIDEKNRNLYELIVPLISTLINNTILFKKRNETLYELNEKNVELVISKNEISKLTISIVSALEDASLFRDKDMGLHIQKVRKYSELLATGIDLEIELVGKIGLYSGLHDIGKLAVKYEILHKPDKYSDPEYEEMKKHTIWGYNIIDRQGIDSVAKNIVLYHHERYGGKGYPHGLTGDEIPIEARVVSLANVYDVLCRNKKHKNRIDDKEIEIIINNERGKQFDPHMVDVFFQNLNEIKDIRNSLVIVN